VSLLVDEIGDVVEVGPERFEVPPDTLDVGLRRLITGAYKLDSSLLLILDVDQAVAA
jgi:purine-binding chemotaxis protein CheW